MKLFKNIPVTVMWVQGGGAQGKAARSLLDWKLHEEKGRKEALPRGAQPLTVCLARGTAQHLLVEWMTKLR